ncbi:uncharacterized protein LOC131232866 isoform X2 [Magnolia sinica]|uniref:uncharacterized protein LOC131232866 isoform X2 n=1 Tax=Magnolia sinica TaxID=86752 RepID=UPI0026593A0C|nr:uncharacterized protein LOC131232866 isoform X2 [Magnolia sinica]
MTINAQHPSTNSHFAKPNSPLKVREIFVEWRMENLQIVPALACKNVEAQYVEMKVPLYSYGCEKKIKKALSHLRGRVARLADTLQVICCTRSASSMWNILSDRRLQASEGNGVGHL